MTPSADTYGGWKNHFLRLGRWRDRALTALGDYDGHSFHDANDFVLAYFVWCHSMREWLINSGAISRQRLDWRLHEFVEWEVCRDIANRSRHFELRRKPRDKDWSIRREHDIWAQMEDRPMRHKLFVVSGDRIFEADELVDRTYEMWLHITQQLD